MSSPDPDFRDPTNHFRISADGESFDVESYIQQCPFTVASIWRRGELRPNSQVAFDSSGLIIELTKDVDLDDFAGQQEVAVAFLETNEAALRQLRDFAGVTTFYLGLQDIVWTDSLGSIMDVSPALMRIAIKLELGITIWACTSARPFAPREATE